MSFSCDCILNSLRFKWKALFFLIRLKFLEQHDWVTWQLVLQITCVYEIEEIRKQKGFFSKNCTLTSFDFFTDLIKCSNRSVLMGVKRGGGGRVKLQWNYKMIQMQSKVPFGKESIPFKDPFWCETEGSYLKKCLYTGREVSASTRE